MKRSFAHQVVSALCAVASLLMLTGTHARGAETADPKLAQQSYDLLKKYCYRCHGVEFNGAQSYNVLDRDSLVAKRGGDSAKPRKAYVTPGKPAESVMWRKIESKEMPPEDERDQPSVGERLAIKQWIEAGAPFPGRSERPFKSDKDVLADIRQHLLKTPAEDRPFQRYFTLTHLYNNNKTVTEFDLRLYRAAMSKLANSLSWEPDIALPVAVDKEETVYSIDLRRLGWDKGRLWQEILKQYPYGVTYRASPDAQLRDLWSEIAEITGSDLPYLRADWFIATVSRPPLYYTMLRLPTTDAKLEALLRVDFAENFQRNKLLRAGFASSGVSKQNRMVERHSAAYGAYWKSYDFGPNADRSDLTQFPLGPEFKDNAFPGQAFKQAGGELIFNLPNGLQGYMLVKTDGTRIDVGPIEIVNDSLKTAGTPAIVNGLSCMACHRQGMLTDFKDSIRAGHGLGGEARLKVEQLYQEQEVLDRVMKKDTERFQRALFEATDPFLKVAEDKDKESTAFAEPIGAIARLYVKDLGPTEVALELGIEKPETLQGAIRGNRTLRELGLGPLMQGSTINRERWDSLRQFLSVFQNTARELELGTPYRPL